MKLSLKNPIKFNPKQPVFDKSDWYFPEKDFQQRLPCGLKCILIDLVDGITMRMPMLPEIGSSIKIIVNDINATNT
jgi:hypothetical protein